MIEENTLFGSSLIIREIEEKLSQLSGEETTVYLAARNNNYSFTDGKKFFIKVSTISDRQPVDREVGFILKYGSNGDKTIPTFTLLDEKVGEIIQPFMSTLAESFKNYYTIWELEEGVCGFDSTSDGKAPQSFTQSGLGYDRAIFDVMTEQLTQIHQLPTDGFNLYNYEMVNHKISQRLEYLDIMKPEHVSYRDNKRLRELKDAFITPEMMGFKNNVLCHSDSHIGNFVSTKSFPNGVWIDYESVSVAPKELDLTPISLFYKHHLKDMDAWQFYVDSFNRYSVNAGNGEIDFDVLNRLELIKAYSRTTFLILEEDKGEVLSERLDILEKSLNSMILQGYCY